MPNIMASVAPVPCQLRPGLYEMRRPTRIPVNNALFRLMRRDLIQRSTDRGAFYFTVTEAA